MCQIVDRYEAISVTPAEYHDAAHHVNGMLKTLCDVEPHIHFHAMKGFNRNSPEIWSWDGIHPNKPRGRDLYKRVLRSAIFKSLKTLNPK